MGKRASEIIADHLGWDQAELRQYQYQPGRYSCAIYTTGDADYWCCPGGQRKPPAGWDWKPVQNDYLGSRYPGRTVYWANTLNEQEP